MGDAKDRARRGILELLRSFGLHPFGDPITKQPEAAEPATPQPAGMPPSDSDAPPSAGSKLDAPLQRRGFGCPQLLVVAFSIVAFRYSLKAFHSHGR